MKQKRVWVIEQGSYSDYHVVGVFSSMEKAQIVHDALSDKCCQLHDIACWPVDAGVTNLQRGYAPWYIIMLRDGTVERCEQVNASPYNIAPEFNIWRRTQAPAYKGKEIPDALQATVWARNRKHAIKIANEHRAMMIANREWD